MKIIGNKKIYTVSEIDYIARQVLEEMLFWVEGEIFELSKNPDWAYCYLKLKDDYAVLPCVTGKDQLANFGENLVGQKILAFGNLTLYEPRGQFQFRIRQIENAGEGLIAKQLEALIKKLKAEGLFDESHKKPLPLYPKKVCLVTSAGSDAWNDFVTHSVSKYPIIQLSTADIRVQGKETIPNLLKILPKIDKKGFDVMVITRGGGSLEDLAAFNDEEVVRTIYSLTTPTVVAIGHESNESLAEWVADKRASTPTDAANVITLGYSRLEENLATIKSRLLIYSDRFMQTNMQKLDHFLYCLEQTKNKFKDLPHKLNTLQIILTKHERILIKDAIQRSDNAFKSILRYMQLNTSSKLEHLLALKNSLEILSPENTLKRGYSITYSKSGQIIKSVNAIVTGSYVGVKLSDGSFNASVKSKIKNG